MVVVTLVGMCPVLLPLARLLAMALQSTNQIFLLFDSEFLITNQA